MYTHNLWSPRILAAVAVAAILTLAACKDSSTNPQIKPQQQAKAKSLGNQTLSEAYARGIAQACVLMSTDSADILPDHLAIPLLAGKITPKELIDPRTDHQPMDNPAANADWKNIAADVDAHCDFYYVGKGMLNSDGNIIILYDKLATGKRIIGFSDGHSEAVDQGGGKWYENLQYTNGERKKRNLPPLPDDLKGPPQ